MCQIADPRVPRGYVIRMITALPLYESGTALSQGAILATILMGALAVWATLHVARPNQTLTYDVKSRRPATSSDGIPPRLAAGRRGSLEILEIRLHARGRNDITSAAFDLAEPLKIRVEGNILELLDQSAYSPPNRRARAPKVDIKDGALLVGPSLIASGQTYVYKVLAEVNPRKPTAEELAAGAPRPPLDFYYLQKGRRRLIVRGFLIDVRIKSRSASLVTTGLLLAAAAGIFLIDPLLAGISRPNTGHNPVFKFLVDYYFPHIRFSVFSVTTGLALLVFGFAIAIRYTD